MSVYKPKTSSIWLYDFQHQGRRFYGSTGQKTKRQAETVEREKREAAKLGRLNEVSQMTLNRATDRWWTEVGQHRKDGKTSGAERASKLERRLGAMVKVVGPGRTLGEIDQVVVAEAIERRRGQAYRRSAAEAAKAYAPSNTTVNRDVIDCLRPILRRARTHWSGGGPSGLPEINWSDLRLKEPAETVRVYDSKERSRWLDEATRTGWWGGRTPRGDAADVSLALDLLLTYGLRFAELYFRPEAFKAEERKLIYVREGGEADRKLGVPHEVALLDRHALALAPLVATAKLHKLEHVWFWLDKKRRPHPIPASGLMARLNNAAERARVPPGRRIHGARHHAGTTFYAHTKDLKLTQQFLGHADPQSTMRYVHADKSAVRAAIEGIDRQAPAKPAKGSKR